MTHTVSCEVFQGILLVVLSVQIFSLSCIPIPKPFFLKKAKILQDFISVPGVWFWAEKNFGSSHHASVVRN